MIEGNLAFNFKRYASNLENGVSTPVQVQLWLRYHMRSVMPRAWLHSTPDIPFSFRCTILS